ncbi:ACP S-malonyltransferase [Tumebacillus sp. ITR2]|uniref:Malonyl CoA-acyl carrier protein transacylase n=1 Tax=Tumebacillus amylolyticus TaxID=2801339 RepID=A0ABS1JBH5_9BACL|nr:ACP S-malonyltransferase [Tumebacillus amylolyticus]MBL0387618.1 ACP S-malonyltransferase [Tumebacillus amylolyticus]
MTALRYVVMFPGQGSQYVGMGQEIADHSPAADHLYEVAEKFSGMPIRSISSEGPEDLLQETANTQPCLLVASIACFEALREEFPTPPTYVLGHSAGEFAALVAAGALSFEDAVLLIQKRGQLMGEMANGGMAALKNVTLETAQRICKEAVVPGGALVTANLNSPNQIVISGDEDSIEEAVMYCLERDIEVVPLAVSGAFHSPLMQPAAEEFAENLSRATFSSTTIPVISNVTAEPTTDGDAWPELLAKQMVSPVLFEPSIRGLGEAGITTFVEVGPKNVLSRLIRRILPEAQTLHVQDLASLHETVARLQALAESSKTREEISNAISFR